MRPTCTGKYEQARVVTGVERVCSGAATVASRPESPTCTGKYEQARVVTGVSRGDRGLEGVSGAANLPRRPQSPTCTGKYEQASVLSRG